MNPVSLQRFRILLSDGNLEGVFAMFDTDTADKHILTLKSRFERLQQKRMDGTISFEQEELETNRIVAALLDWSDNLEIQSRRKVLDENIQVDEQLISLIKHKLAKSLSFYYLTALVPILTGIALAATFYRVDQGMDVVEGLSSALVAAVSGFSFREIVKRKDKISFLDILLTRVTHLHDPYEIQKIKSLSWSLIESAILKSGKHG